MPRPLRSWISFLLVAGLMVSPVHPALAATEAWRSADLPGDTTSEMLKKALIIGAAAGLVLVIVLVSHKPRPKSGGEAKPAAPAAADSTKTGYVPVSGRGLIRASSAVPAELFEARCWEVDLTRSRVTPSRAMTP